MKANLASEQEIEVKFYLRHPHRLRRILHAAGARKVAARVHEINLRFDFPDGHLTREHRVLRLRRDSRAVLTYKGPSDPQQPVSMRQEIEVVVADFTATRHLLEALGLQVSVMYEKKRTTYALGSVHVMLDEMPYGIFCEIEGPDAESIRRAAETLGLNWDARVTVSYLALFERVRLQHHLDIANLTFEGFAGLEISPADLGVQPADEG